MLLPGSPEKEPPDEQSIGHLQRQFSHGQATFWKRNTIRKQREDWELERYDISYVKESIFLIYTWKRKLFTSISINCKK